MDRFGTLEEVAAGRDTGDRGGHSAWRTGQDQGAPHQGGPEQNPGAERLAGPVVPPGDGFEGGQGLAPATARHRPKIGWNRAKLLPGHAGHGHRHAHLPGVSTPGVIGPKVSADQAHDILEQKVEPEEVFNFHVSYINHGRQVCRAQRPKCAQCVVGGLCPSRKRFLTKAELAELAAAEEQTPAGSGGAPMPHVPQSENRQAKDHQAEAKIKE